jgi:hypothetical protein
MKRIFILLISLAISSNVLTMRNRRLADDWLLFKKTYNKTYSDINVEKKR